MEWNDQYGDEHAENVGSGNATGIQGWDGHAHYTVRPTDSGKWLAMCQGRGGHFFGAFATEAEAKEVCEQSAGAWAYTDEAGIDLL
jgi:hypothetical protein